MSSSRTTVQESRLAFRRSLHLSDTPEVPRTRILDLVSAMTLLGISSFGFALLTSVYFFHRKRDNLIRSSQTQLNETARGPCRTCC